MDSGEMFAVNIYLERSRSFVCTLLRSINIYVVLDIDFLLALMEMNNLYGQYFSLGILFYGKTTIEKNSSNVINETQLKLYIIIE